MKKSKQFPINQKIANGEELTEFEKLMLEAGAPPRLVRNQIVEGVVVNKYKSGWMVDIGQKSDSIVSSKECSEDLQIGETYTFLVYSDPDELDVATEGGVALSYDKAQSWVKLGQLAESGDETKAKVYAVQNYRGGGVSGVKAVIHGVRAFIPRRELNHRGDVRELIDMEIPVEILHADSTNGRFGKLMIKPRTDQIDAKIEAKLATLKPGQIVTGVVFKFIEPGALVNLGDHAVGLIYNTEFSNDPNVERHHVAKVDEEVEVRVLRVNMERLQVSLSMRSVNNLAYLESLKAGDHVIGTVTNVISAGVLVDLEGKATGLVHRTEVASFRNADPAKVVKVGEEIPVKVLNVDLDERKVSLSRIQAIQEPFLADLKEGAVVEGVVSRLQNYGAFVTLGGCVDGLLHVTDMQSASGVTETFKTGEHIRVKVESIDLKELRISLSRKGLSSADETDGDRAA